MKPALVRANINRLVHYVFGDALQPGVLQQFLDQTNVNVCHGSRCEIRFADKRLHQHRRAQHFVVIEMLRPLCA